MLWETMVVRYGLKCSLVHASRINIYAARYKHHCNNTILFHIYLPFPLSILIESLHKKQIEIFHLFMFFIKSTIAHKKTETFNLFLIVIMDFPKLWPTVMFFFYKELTNEQIQQFCGNLFQRQQHLLSKSKNKPVLCSSLFFKEWTGGYLDPWQVVVKKIKEHTQNCPILSHKKNTYLLILWKFSKKPKTRGK
jgi:hypothetical protein